LKKAISPPEDGLAKFTENYRPDGIDYLTPEEVERLPSYSTCIACHLCDAHCPIAKETSPALFPGPSWLVMCAGRSMPAFPATLNYLSYWEKCGDCRRCEEVCPARIPLKELASFVDRKCRTLLS
jgi:succinate dehydrogenase/fumarate reductase-like Fe-S protein